MKTKFNICFITQEYSPYTSWGGIGTYYHQLANKLGAAKHDITIISRYHSGLREVIISDNFRIIFIGLPFWLKYIVGRTIDKIIHSFIVYTIVKKVNKNISIDIIETPEVNLEAFMLMFNKILREKVIVQCHGSNYFGVVPSGIFTVLHKLDILISFYIEMKILRSVGNIIVPSSSGATFLRNLGIPKSKISLVYHGVDTDMFCKKNNINDYSVIKIGFVGRLENRKGLDFIWKLVELFNDSTPVEIHLVGSIHKSIKKKVKYYFNKYKKFVIYHKPINYVDMPKFYNSIHMLLVPSKFEQFGLIYAEAMACELVVFAGINGGGQEIINHNTNGFLVDSIKDINFVLEEILKLHENPELFCNIKQKARSRIIENFSAKKMVKEKLRYYIDFKQW